MIFLIYQFGGKDSLFSRFDDVLQNMFINKPMSGI